MTVDKITISEFLMLGEKRKVAQTRSRLASEKHKLGIHASIPWNQLEEQLADEVVHLLDLKLLDFVPGGMEAV